MARMRTAGARSLRPYSTWTRPDRPSAACLDAELRPMAQRCGTCRRRPATAATGKPECDRGRVLHRQPAGQHGARRGDDVSTPHRVSLNATIPAATVNGPGRRQPHVAVRAQDALGNWGAFGTITLKVDKTGPGTSTRQLRHRTRPTARSACRSARGGGFYERIDATVSDPVSGGINSEHRDRRILHRRGGANGTGGAMFATMACINGTDRAGVRGGRPVRDQPRCRRATTRSTSTARTPPATGARSAPRRLFVDKTAPTFTGISLAPNPTNGAATVVLTVNGAADTGGAGVAGGEYWINPPTTTTRHRAAARNSAA